jgi:antirestriction protein ArdC
MPSRAADWPTADQRLAALHDKLVAAVEELTTSPAWLRMLQVAARFHDYSPSNVLLIAVQRPDATRVAGLRTWNSLGRRVRKGEHGIAILAPGLSRQRDIDVPTPDRAAPEAAQLVENDAGASAGLDDPATRRELRGFRVVHVFDVTQTDGEPLPEVAPELLVGPAPHRLWERLAGLAEADGYRIERGPCGGANGYTSFAQRLVRIRDDVDPAQAVKTLAHEIGHIHADHENRFPDYAIDRTCRGEAEIEAESIAYIVTSAAGLESPSYSVPYIAAWLPDDAMGIRHTAARVLGTARQISDALTCVDDRVDAADRSRAATGALRSSAQDPRQSDGRSPIAREWL